MVYRKFRIVLSKGWTVLICSVSIAVLALMSSCRSKKVPKTAEAVEEEPQTEEVDDFSYNSTETGAPAPVVALPGDSKEVKEMIQESNAIRNELTDRMNTVIYGTPEVMKRRAEENRIMREKIDSISIEINKARKK